MDEERLKLIIEAQDHASAVLATVGRHLGEIEGQARAAVASAAEAGRSLGATEISWQRVAGAAAAFGAAVAGAGYATLKASEAAADQADQLLRLRTLVEQNGGSWSEWGKRIGDTTDRLQSTTEFASGESRTALTMLIGLTGDLDGSFRGLNIAAGMTRVTQQDLSGASRLVAQAMVGNVEMLGKYVPGLRGAIAALGDDATASDKAAVAMRMLQSQFGGLVTAIDPTKQGLAEIRNNLGDLPEAFGGAINAGGGMARVYGAVADAVKTFERTVTQNADAIRAFARGALLVGIDALVLFGGAATKAAQVAAALTSVVSGAVGVLVRVFESSNPVTALILGRLGIDLRAAGDAALGFAETSGGAIETMGHAFDGVTGAASGVRAAIGAMPVHVVEDIERSSTGAGKGFRGMADGARAAAEAMKALTPESFAASPEAGLTGMLRAGDADALSNALDHLGVATGTAREEQVQFAFAVQAAAEQAYAAGTLSVQEYRDATAAAQSSLERLGESMPAVGIQMDGFKAKVEDAKQTFFDFSGAVASGIGSIAESFGSLFADLATGANDPFKAFTANILRSFGQFLSQFGQGLIAYGIAALALQTALFNPLGAIAAGVALVAAGALLASLGSNAASEVSGRRGGAGGGARGYGPAFRPEAPAGGGAGGGTTTIVNVSLGGNPLLTRAETARAVADGVAAATRTQARPVPA